MKVFVTGATGFVGTAVVQELLAAGHQVLGLARSAESENKLIAAGAEVHRGDLNDLESLKSGAASSGAVVHLGFIHDFTRFAEVCAIDQKVIETIGETLMGTDKPFIITSGTALVSGDKIAKETDRNETSANPRIATENAADSLVAMGIKVAVVRLSPSVHGDDDKHGFVPILINLANEKGLSAFINEGNNVWPAVHRLDAAKIYRLALENPFESGTRFHAAGEKGVTFKSIATAIAENLNIPVVSFTNEEAAKHFTWFTHFATINNPTSSETTRATLNWNPRHQTLLEDLQSDIYFSDL